jgi:predicted HNH restriction endonuclease
VICGYSKSVSALAFHHLDPAHKDFGHSDKGLTRSWEAIRRELDKCQLLCLNCHAEVHARQHAPTNVGGENIG